MKKYPRHIEIDDNIRNVTLIDITDTCLPTYYDTKFTDLMKQRLEEAGINLITI